MLKRVLTNFFIGFMFTWIGFTGFLAFFNFNVIYDCVDTKELLFVNVLIPTVGGIVSIFTLKNFK